MFIVSSRSDESRIEKSPPVRLPRYVVETSLESSQSSFQSYESRLRVYASMRGHHVKLDFHLRTVTHIEVVQSDCVECLSVYIYFYYILLYISCALEERGKRRLTGYSTLPLSLSASLPSLHCCFPEDQYRRMIKCQLSTVNHVQVS